MGGAAFAKSIGAEYVTLVTEGNSEKGIADIRAIIEKTGGNMVLNVDPNDAPDGRPIVDACTKAGVYVTTQWTRPADLHPWDCNPYYVSYITFDNLKYGEATADALIKAIGGSGGIVALNGILSSDAATGRRAGLEKALAANPNVKLLDVQIASWKSTEAYTIVSAWLTRFGDKIKGIWCANDDMATGALEALRAESLAGKVLVTGIDGIKLAVREFARARLSPRSLGIPTGKEAWDYLSHTERKLESSIPPKNPKNTASSMEPACWLPKTMRTSTTRSR